MQKKTKFGFQHLLSTTPKIFKRLGNSLLAVSVFVSGYSFYNSHEYIGYIGIGSGILGTLLCNMFTQD